MIRQTRPISWIKAARKEFEKFPGAARLIEPNGRRNRNSAGLPYQLGPFFLWRIELAMDVRCGDCAVSRTVWRTFFCTGKSTMVDGEGA